MAEVSLTVQPSFRDIQGRFTKANDDLLKDKRDEMRSLGQRWVKFMREEAPKNTGKFAEGIRFTTRQQGETITLNGTMPQPLGTFITEGTKPHPIFPKRAGGFLRFNWPKAGGIVFFRSVNHPGTKPNKFSDRAFRKWEPSTRVALNRITVNWVNKVSD
jgi:hypothetical protein